MQQPTNPSGARRIKRKVGMAKPRKPTNSKSINVYYSMDQMDEFKQITQEADSFGLSWGDYILRLARIGHPIAKENPVLILTGGKQG
jgi:hypothetical protein